jgi:hypothetical protein
MLLHCLIRLQTHSLIDKIINFPQQQKESQ